MFDLDNNIKAVVNEAKGSTRFLSPVDINSGQLFIDQGGDNRTEWVMRTSNRMIEPETDFTEGDLHLFLKETAIEGEYDMKLFLDYNDINVDLSLGHSSEFQNPFQGRFSFSIKNNGEPAGCTGNCPVEVVVEVTG